MSSQLNRSYIYAHDTVHGWNYTTFFSFFNEFNRPDEKMKYVETGSLITLSVISFIINAGLINFFLRTKEFRTYQHMLVISVLSSSFLLLPFSIIIGVNRLSPDGWMFGDFACRTTLYILSTTAFIKIWLMSIISIDRYLKVIHPTNFHLGKRSSLLLTIAAWILPMGTLAAMLYPNTTAKETQINGNTTVTICSIMFKYHPTISHALIYFSILFIFEFIFPATLMAVCYLKILYHIRRSSEGLTKRNRNNRKRDITLRNNGKEKRTTKILLGVLMLFLLMWSPLFVLLAYLSIDYTYKIFYLSSKYIIGQICMLLTNTVIEPVLFAFTIGQVRQKLSSLCIKRSK